MMIAILILIPVLLVYVCRRNIKRAIKRQVRKAEDRLAQIIIASLKSLYVATARGAGKGYRALVKLA